MKFLPNLATIAEPLYRLTKKGVDWTWGKEENSAFCRLKEMLSSDKVLVHFDPKVEVGLTCNASSVVVGAILFHRYSDGTERPIACVLKTFTKLQKNYSQIKKEALSIIYGVTKFHQFLFGRKRILMMDHKPLLANFGPSKGTPVQAANR